MRDEVIAELRNEDNQPSMNLHYHVSGGFAFGWAKLRYKIFCHYITYNLQAIRLGDRAFFDANPEFENAKIAVHFHSTNKKYDKTEQRGILADYRL